MAAAATPSREDFAKMLDESFHTGNLQEGSVIKGKVVGIEKDLAVIDVGLKTEGRVALREFQGPGRQNEIKIGDDVEVYLERVENALGEAVLSRDKARREESWGKLEKAFQNNEKVQGVIFNQVKGGFTVDLDGAVAFLPRSQVDIRPIRDVTPLMNVNQPFQILKMDRRRGNIVVSRRTVLEETRAEQRQELVQNLEEGQVIDGVVKNITDYGVFVDLGGKGAFGGKVADDALGAAYIADMKKIGADYFGSPLKNGPATARSIWGGTLSFILRLQTWGGIRWPIIAPIPPSRAMSATPVTRLCFRRRSS